MSYPKNSLAQNISGPPKFISRIKRRKNGNYDEFQSKTSVLTKMVNAQKS